jgi:CarD family transcriptional regulator
MLEKVTTLAFVKGQFVSYKDKGVGEIKNIGPFEAGGLCFDACTVCFPDGSLVRIPVAKLPESGLRALNDANNLPDILQVLKEPAKNSRLNWKARSGKLYDKLKSGEWLLIAEVARDLYRENIVELSYTEQQYYLNACQILVKEIAIIKKITETESLQFLNKETGKTFCYQIGKVDIAVARRTDHQQKFQAKSETAPIAKPMVKAKPEKTPTKTTVARAPKVARKDSVFSTTMTAYEQLKLQKVVVERQVADLTRQLTEERAAWSERMKAAVEVAKQPLLLLITQLESEISKLRGQLAEKESECTALRQQLETRPTTPVISVPTPKEAPVGWIRNRDGSLRRDPKK